MLNNSVVSKLIPRQEYYDVWDVKITGLHVRVSPTGKKVYRCRYARNKNCTFGKIDLFTVAEAREKALSILADAVQGKFPMTSGQKKKSGRVTTLKDFLDNEYKPWMLANRKTGKKTLKLIEFYFSNFLNRNLDDIKLLDIERWRTKKLEQGLKPSTVNRELGRLQAALSKAVEWEYLTFHPLKKMKPLSVDVLGRVRYLTDKEESNLRKALLNRDKQIKSRRMQANTWRRERNYDLLSSLGSCKYGDYLTPMVLLTLNTGLRLGEIFNLRWDKVDFVKQIITIVGRKSKTHKTLYVPLNKEATQILRDWRQQSADDGLVFPGKEGKPLTDISKSWKGVLKKAKESEKGKGIEDFHWHDLRHHFASKLVMSGADLNSVRELLGHSNLDMTLRYAHLAPEHKAKIVALLDV